MKADRLGDPGLADPAAVVDVPGFVLERADDDPHDAPSVDQRAARAEAFFREEVRSAMSVAEALRAAGSNGYPPADAPVHRPRRTGALFPTRDNVCDGFFVDLRPGRSLLRGSLLRPRYSSFVFYDRWFNAPDFPEHRCYLTDRDIETAADGSYEIVLGPDDPGHPDGIDTAGLRQGIFAIRCLLLEFRTLPEVQIVPSCQWSGPLTGGTAGQGPRSGALRWTEGACGTT